MAVFVPAGGEGIIPPEGIHGNVWGDMASYDLVCNECGNEFEVYVQGFLKDGDRVCPECDSAEVRQKFSSFLRNLGCGAAAGSGFG